MYQFRKAGWLTGLICLVVFGFSVKPALAADKVTGGIEVGVNINKPSLDIPGLNADTTVKAGLLIGGFAQFSLSDVVAIQPEFVYSQKHTDVSASQSGGSFSAHEALDFFEIPVLLRLNARHAAGHAGFYAVVGPGFGFRVRAKESDSFNNGKASTPDPNLGDELQRVDVSIIGGAGISKGKWDLEARYDAGLRNLNKDNKLGNGIDLKNRTTSIIFRWRFK